jgi:hypothetical protein
MGARSEWQALSHLRNCSAHTLYCPGPCGRPSRQRPWYWSPLGKYFVPAGVPGETVSTPSGWLHKRQRKTTHRGRASGRSATNPRTACRLGP